MSFDFSNYTYSGLLTIFSMVMGMVYPTIQAAIQNIDAKYDSAQIVKCFETEKSYHTFRISLALSIVLALCSPFVLMLLGVSSVLHFTWMFLHTLAVLFLLASTIKLFMVIMTYGKAGELVEHFKKRANQEKIEIASLLAEIANFAASKGQKKVYLSALNGITTQLNGELREQRFDIKQTQFDTNNPSTFNSSLSEDMNMAIERMVGILVNRDYNVFFTCDVTIVSLFYNVLEQHPMSDGIRNIVWRMVSDVVLSGNKEWFVLYWGYADQYVRTMEMNRIRNRKDQEKLQTIREFHIAICGMLIKYGKTSWLRDILFYTNTQPPSYPILCNTFADVVDMYKWFERRLRYPYMWYMQQHYPMHGMNSGVNTDANTVRYVEMFIAVMYLRLWYLDSYLLHNKPRENLSLMSSVDENQRYVDLLERLIWSVNEAFDKGLNSKVDFKIPKRKEAIALIEQNILNFKREIEKNINNPKIDEQKRTQLIESVVKAAKEWDNGSDNENKISHSEVKHLFKTLTFNIPKDYLLEKYELSPGDLGINIIGGLKACFQSILSTFFQSQAAVEEYQIAYEYVGEALRLLDLNSDYVVIGLGFNFNSYFELSAKRFIEYQCRNNQASFSNAMLYEKEGYGKVSILVLRKDEIPYGEIVKDENEKECLITNDNLPIYSNIEKITPNDLERLLFRIYVDIHYPKDFRFVRIIVPNVFTSNTYDLKNVQPIAQLLGK